MLHPLQQLLILDAHTSFSALDKSGEGGRAIVKIVREHAKGSKVVAGETSSANSGGQSGITDTFINSFWYLDQLGSLAVAGVSGFQRQVLISAGGYPLIEVRSHCSRSRSRCSRSCG